MSWSIFDRYVFKNIFISCVVICSVLTLLIMVVQSIRFLELVINSGASLNAFAGLLILSIPSFVEVVLPISLMISILFFYNKIIMDSEMIIMRSAGSSPLSLFKPAIVLGGILMISLFLLSSWIAPYSIAKIQLLRQDIRAQYAALLFREGIFNTVGSGLTAYIRERGEDGMLYGLMIHDTRDEIKGGNAYTVVAKRGVSVSDEKGQKVIVYEGTRHELDKQRQTLSRLDFEQYTIEIPEKDEDIRARWKEPDERTMGELLDFASVPEEDRQHIPQFIGEANRRFSLPFLLLSYTMISGCFLMIGALDRRGLSYRLFGACIGVVATQGAYLYLFNLTKHHPWANYMLYIIPISIILLCFYLLTPAGDRIIKFFKPKPRR